MYGFEHLEERLRLLEEIVLTGETILFYRKKNNYKSLEKQLDILDAEIQNYKKHIDINDEM